MSDVDYKKLKEIIDKGFETLENSYKGKWNIFFPMCLYDAQSKEDMTWYYSTHPEQNTYFLGSMFDKYIYKLKMT